MNPPTQQKMETHIERCTIRGFHTRITVTRASGTIPRRVIEGVRPSGTSSQRWLIYVVALTLIIWHMLGGMNQQVRATRIRQQDEILTERTVKNFNTHTPTVKSSARRGSLPYTTPQSPPEQTYSKVGAIPPLNQCPFYVAKPTSANQGELHSRDGRVMEDDADAPMDGSRVRAWMNAPDGHASRHIQPHQRMRSQVSRTSPEIGRPISTMRNHQLSNHKTDQQTGIASSHTNFPLASPSDPAVISLMTFYNASGGSDWYCSRTDVIPNWGNYSVSVCDWTGITCNEWGYIVGIQLHMCNVQGFQPTMFAALVNLTAIDLGYNCLWNTDGTFFDLTPFQQLEVFSLPSSWNLVAVLPDSFFQLRKLFFIDLNFGTISSQFSQFAQLPNLKHLELTFSHVSGLLTELQPLAKTLQYLYLTNAQLTAQSLPPFTGFTQLQTLAIAEASLTGPFPSFNLPVLQTLILGDNLLTGTIPTQYLPSLRELLLSGTRLVGGLVGLANSTKLNSLDLSLAPLDIDLNFICATFPQLGSLLIQSPNSVEGQLTSLEGCSMLSTLTLSDSGLTGSIPDLNMTQLTSLSLSMNQLTGTIPPFTYATSLSTLDLSSNQLSGTVPFFPSINTSQTLTTLTLSSNQLNGSLPTFLMADGTPPQSLSSLDLGDNEFTGTFPVAYDTYPNLIFLSVKNNRLTGELPPQFSSRTISFFLINGNMFTGPLPSVWFSGALTLFHAENNYLSGPLDFSSWTVPMLFDLSVNSNQLYCPVRFPEGNVILRLDLSRNWLNSTCVDGMSFLNQLPRIQYFDGSFNNWAGTLPFITPTSLKSYSCQSCNLNTQIPSSWELMSNLIYLQFSNNSIYGNLYTMPISCVTLDVSHNRISPSIGDQLSTTDQLSHAGVSLQILDFSFNGITGHLFPTIFQTDLLGFPILPNLIQVKGNNNNMFGPLPEVTPNSPVQIVDLAHNNFAGPIPESFANFFQLRELRLEGNPLLQAPPGLPLPSFLTTDITGVTTSTSVGFGWSCPSVKLISNPTAIVTLDPSYYGHSLCTCNDKYFGEGNQCQLCPAEDQCQCNGKVISNCFPISTPSADPDAPLYVFLPCPLTILGQSLCNPNLVPWNFNDPNSSDVASSGASSSGWCFPGHEGRVCSQCQDNYFASGRWCLQCLTTGYHIIIFICSGLLFVLLILFLSYGAPKISSLIEAEHKLSSSELRQLPTRPITSTLLDASSTSSHTSLQSTPSSNSSVTTERMIAISSMVASNEFSSWKLLVFHCQSLGILLLTQTSLPSVLVTFISIVSSGTGFSLSSLVAVECVTEWKLSNQLQSSLVAPGIILLVVIILWFIERSHLSRRRQGHDAHGGGNDSLGPAQSSLLSDRSLNSFSHLAFTISSISNPTSLDASGGLVLPTPLVQFIWKCHSVCFSLLYILFFPSSQLSLAALGCTDTRQPGQSYLNLYSWIECDQEWQSQILPYALIGGVVWVILFPLGSILLTIRLNRLFMNQQDIRVWPVLGEFLSPYHRQYWYWEQIILLRRLGLVMILAFVPGYSVYFPLLLFTLIQLTVLLQHQCHPYRQVWNHRAELASLYLLLVNYFTALVLHQSQSADTGTSGQLSVNGWAILLLIANVAFVLLLITFSSGWLRKQLKRFWLFVRDRIDGAIGDTHSQDVNVTHSSSSPAAPSIEADGSLESLSSPLL